LGRYLLKVDPNFHNEKGTDWIGVYKKGSSTAWKNVIEWEWAKDIIGWEYKLPDLKKGDYEIRYFKNNSYKISDSYSLHIDKLKPQAFRKKHQYKNGFIDAFTTTYEEQGEKDWIGYFKKGASNTPENIIKGFWVKDLICSTPIGCHDMVPSIYLAPGEYELRYFKNNSYKVYKEPLNLNIKKVPSTLEEIWVRNTLEKANSIDITLIGIGDDLRPNPKDWFALYPIHSTNAKENVVQWSWAKDAHLVGTTSYFKMKNIKPGTYEIRYFLNNSFTTYAKSEPFTIK